MIYVVALGSVAVMMATAVTLAQYDYPHAWVSAHYAVMGRTFLDEGVIALGGVPIQNNAPLTGSPDAYLNWPPLYAWLLSIVYAILGESERVHHAVATLINLCIAGLAFQFVRRAAGLTVAVTVVVVFLNLPIVAKYGHVGLQVHLANLLAFACLYCFVLATQADLSSPSTRRRHAVVGGALMLAAAMTSWEPPLAVLGLLVVALLRRDWRAFRLAVAYGVVATATIAIVFAMYAQQYPYFVDAIVNRALIRAGLVSADAVSSVSALSSHLIQDANTMPGALSPAAYVGRVLLPRMVLLGPVGLVAVALALFLLVLRAAPVQPRWTYVYFGLLGIYLAWSVALRQHNQLHEYQFILMAPVAAVATGLSLYTLCGTATSMGASGWRRTVVVATCLAIAVTALVGRSAVTLNLFDKYRPGTDPHIAFGREIARRTEPGAIVAHTEGSMVPVYYAERHVIRGVYDETVLRRHRAAIEALCAECPLYMAIQRGREQGFAILLRDSTSRTVTRYGTLVRLNRKR